MAALTRSVSAGSSQYKFYKTEDLFDRLTRQNLLEHLIELLVVHSGDSVYRKDGGVVLLNAWEFFYWRKSSFYYIRLNFPLCHAAYALY